MRIKTEFLLTEQLKADWQGLWESSESANIFNSPDWYLSATSVSRKEKTLIVTCYAGKKLVGVLPLVVSKKYGINCYQSPGRNYLDKSTFLSKKEDALTARTMIKGLMRIGTFYLIGVDQFFVDSLKSIKNLTFKNSSVCPFLMLEPDPFAFLRNKKRKRIERAIEEGKGQFSVKIYKGQSEELLKILQKVEYKSPKRSSYKDSLSDTYLDDLLLSLNRLNKNHLLTIVLYFKEEPVGFQYGFLYRGVFHGGNMAYKAEFADFVPGRVLVYLMLPELLKMGIKMVDFSRGDSQFKREFTPNFYTQYSISYSSDFLPRLWWKFIEGAFSYLEAHPKLFEIARIGKNIFVRKFVSVIKGNILISKEKITLASGKVEKI